MRNKKVIPWVEVNEPDSPSQVDPQKTAMEDCLDGLAEWSRAADMAIVSTKLDRAEKVYGPLRVATRRPRWIIGGLKTYAVPGATDDDDRPYDYAHAETWKRIAAEACAIVELTGVLIVVLENETALKKFHAGQAGIDFGALYDALAPLRRSDLTYWWWFPCVLDDTEAAPDRRRRSIALTAMVASAVPKSRFIMAHAGRPEWYDNAGEVRQRREMIDLVGNAHVLDLVYVRRYGLFSNGKPAFKAEQVLAEKGQWFGDQIILYPGARDWTSVGRQVAALVDATESEDKHVTTYPAVRG